MPTHYSAEEQYRIHGRIEGAAAEELLDAKFQVDAMDGMGDLIREARGCYPGEDVLTRQITNLNKLAKNVRGNNKAELEDIIEELIEARRELYDNAEHGRDELKKALAALGAT